LPFQPYSIAAHVAIRGLIREKRGIRGSVFMDLLYVIVFPFCALVQDTQEVHDMLGLTGDEQPPPDSIVRI
jgi:Cys-rich protein (TIGR01571 family)